MMVKKGMALITHNVHTLLKMTHITNLAIAKSRLLRKASSPPPPQLIIFMGIRNYCSRYFMPAVWGQEMVRQAGDNMPSTGGGGLNVCLALSYQYIVQTGMTT